MNNLFKEPEFLKKDIEGIRALVKAGAFVYVPKDFWSVCDVRIKIRLDPVYIAIQDNELEILKLLIEAGIHLLPFPPNGNTALHYAMSKLPRNRDIEKLLIEAGADVNAKNNKGHTPLEYASKNERISNEMRKLELELNKCEDRNKKRILGIKYDKAKNMFWGNTIIDNPDYEVNDINDY